MVHGRPLLKKRGQNFCQISPLKHGHRLNTLFLLVFLNEFTCVKMSCLVHSIKHSLLEHKAAAYACTERQKEESTEKAERDLTMHSGKKVETYKDRLVQ